MTGASGRTLGGTLGGGTGDVLGRGMAFPPRVGADGRFVWSEGERNVRESIAVVLKTEPGERVGVPDFGAGLGGFLFEPNEPATHARIAHAVARALARWEGRVEVEAVDVGPHPSGAAAALATVTYRLVATAARERISLSVALGAG